MKHFSEKSCIYFVILTLLGCNLTQPSYKSVTISADNTSDYEVHYISTDSTDLGVNLTVKNLNGKSVYLVFSNTSTSMNASNPTVAINSNQAYRDEVSNNLLSNVSYGMPHSRSDTSSNLRDVVGDREYFSADTLDSYTDNISAYCAKTVEVGDKQLSIFVQETDTQASSSRPFSSPSKKVWGNTITQEMVDALADKFMREGDDNDIYDWVTNLYGEEWGEHDSDSFIQPNNNITILLFNIHSSDPNATELGYFYSKDNYLKEKSLSSNERIMFYINASFFNKKDGLSWEITDPNPTLIVSTLAHEFQHVIAFYQKIVKNGKTEGISTWLNETCSLATEDIIADKLGIEGPRGRTTAECLELKDEKTGQLLKDTGRIWSYNNSCDKYPIYSWGSSDAAYYYDPAYMFAAFLMRNYGGPQIFCDIVGSDILTADAVALVTGQSLEMLLRQWGVAVLLSDLIDDSLSSSHLQYNFGSVWQPYKVGNIIYNLGSINAFNYYYKPKIYLAKYSNTLTIGDSNSLKKSTNRFAVIGENVSGTIRKKITFDPTVQLSVIIRDKI